MGGERETRRKNGPTVYHFEGTGSPRILRSAHGARNDAKTHLSRGAIAVALFAAERHRCSAVIWHDLNDETKYKR